MSRPVSRQPASSSAHAVLALSLSLGLLAAPAAAEQAAEPGMMGPEVAMEAAEAELSRALEGLRLPDQPAPYFVAAEIIQGEVATVRASWGALTTLDAGPFRRARVDVRVGDYELDNGNFDMSFGERAGTVSRGLPADDVAVALRRELWLGLDAAYKGAAEQYSAKVAAREGREGEHPPDLWRIQPLVTEPLATPSVDEGPLAELAEALTARAARYPSFEESNAVVRDWQGARVLATTEGTRAWLPTGFAVLRVESVARASDGARLRNTRWWVAADTASLPERAELEAEIDAMNAWLEALRTAPVEEDYLGPVLFEQPAAVELFRQLLAPEIAGTPPPEAAPDLFGDNETGPPTARVGRRLLPEGWNVWDDPTALPEQAGAYTHDFEGVAARRVDVVQDGVVRDLLMSRVPRKDFEASTGHGRALGNERREAMPGQVFVDPPRERRDRALRKRALQLASKAGLDYVLVIRRVEPPALSEDFHVAFSGEGPLPGLTRPVEAYRLYADGREEPVRGLSFVGVDRRVLRDIVMAGDVGEPVDVLDAGMGSRRFSVGAVGGLPATWTVPGVVVTELELRGSGGREPRVLSQPPRD